MGTSAWYAPGAAAAQMAVSILKNERRIYPCCVRLTGQYGIDDLFVGAPVKLGRQGVEHVIELKLTEEEKALLHRSAAAVREVVQALDNMNIL